MSIRNIQGVMENLAERLKTALAGGPLARWRVLPEAGNEVEPIETPEDDLPRVVLQADAGQYAMQGTLHRCFRFECEAVCIFTPSVKNATSFPQLLGKLTESFGDVLAGLPGPLVTEDERAGCYVLQAALGNVSTDVAENSYHFRQSFRLVVQF